MRTGSRPSATACSRNCCSDHVMFESPRPDFFATAVLVRKLLRPFETSCFSEAKRTRPSPYMYARSGETELTRT